MRNGASRQLLCVCFTLFVLLTSFAFSQDPDEHQRLGRKDDPAARELWFRRGRQTRNGQPAAKMLHQAFTTKMRLRAQRESQFRAAPIRHTYLGNPLGASVGKWTNLGPRPIVENTTVPDGYGPTAGRVTAIAVDQMDSTGNTVLVSGAYGGVWRSTNAAAADPTLVQWTPLIDDQPTLSVGAIALQPGNSNVILVGTGEPNYGYDSYYGVGILRSNDGGQSWSTISSASSPSGGYSLYGSGVAQFAFSTNNTNVVVAATSFATFYPTHSSNSIAGTLLSTDAGASWTVVPFTNDNLNFYEGSASSVVYNPKEDKFYAVLPFFGVYVSQGTSATGFSSFVRLKNQPGKAGALSTAACPASFSPNCPLLRGTLTVRPAVNPNDPDQMFIWFVADGSGDAADDQGIWESSTDSTGTVTWSSISDAGIKNCGDSYGCGTTQSFYNLYLNAVPNGTNTDLYAGTINIYKCSLTSSNATCSAAPFQNLTHVYGCSNIAQVHPDQHAMDFLQSNPAIAYFGNDGGVTRSLRAQTGINSGSCSGLNAFDNLNSHIGPLTQFMWGSNHPTDPNTLMGGTQDNGTMAISSASPAPGDAGWWSVNRGDGGYNWIDPVTPTNWYSAYTGVSVQYCTNTIKCDTNTFNSIIEEDLSNGTLHQVNRDNSNFYSPYILDPAKPTQILVGTCRVWRGGNSAASWPNNSNQNALSHKLGATSDASCSTSDDPIQSLAAGGPAGPNGSKVIYAGTSGGHIYVTTNADTGVASWTEITGAVNPNGFPVSAIALDPQDATGMTAYLAIQGFTGASGHLWSTRDGGMNWRDDSLGLPDVPANDIAIDPVTHQIYVATDTGVFTAVPGGGWSEIGPATSASGYLPNVAVLHIALYRNGSDERLRAWTHGRGVWETPITIPDMSISSVLLSFTSPLNQPTAPQAVTFANLGSTAITFGTPTITGPYTSEFSISSATCGTALSPATSCSISLVFDPSINNTGVHDAYLNVLTSSNTYGEVAAALSGTISTNATDFAFTFGSNPTSASVSAGSAATYNFSLDGLPSGSTGFNPAVTLACSGLPSKSSCSFTNTSLAAPGSTSMKIQTNATVTASASPLPQAGDSGSGLLAVLALPGLAVFAPLLTSRARRKRLMMYSAFFVMVVCLLGVTACGGGSSASSTATSSTTTAGTPSGTYNVTITGTYGSITHTQVVTLTVQ